MACMVVFMFDRVGVADLLDISCPSSMGGAVAMMEDSTNPMDCLVMVTATGSSIDTRSCYGC